MAGPHGFAEASMTLIDELKAEPWRFDFYHVLRQIERAHADKPRIGDTSISAKIRILIFPPPTSVPCRPRKTAG